MHVETTRPPSEAASFDVLLFPPPPIGMPSAPVRMTLLVPADQDAKVDTRFAVALLAKLMVADDLGFNGVLGVRGCGDHRGRAGKSDDDRHSCHHWLHSHFVSCSNVRKCTPGRHATFKN